MVSYYSITDDSTVKPLTENYNRYIKTINSLIFSSIVELDYCTITKFVDSVLSDTIDYNYYLKFIPSFLIFIVTNADKMEILNFMDIFDILILHYIDTDIYYNLSIINEAINLIISDSIDKKIRNYYKLVYMRLYLYMLEIMFRMDLFSNYIYGLLSMVKEFNEIILSHATELIYYYEKINKSLNILLYKMFNYYEITDINFAMDYMKIHVRKEMYPINAKFDEFECDICSMCGAIESFELYKKRLSDMILKYPNKKLLINIVYYYNRVKYHKINMESVISTTNSFVLSDCMKKDIDNSILLINYYTPMYSSYYIKLYILLLETFKIMTFDKSYVVETMNKINDKIIYDNINNFLVIQFYEKLIQLNESLNSHASINNVDFNIHIYNVLVDFILHKPFYKNHLTRFSRYINSDIIKKVSFIYTNYIKSVCITNNKNINKNLLDYNARELTSDLYYKIVSYKDKDLV